MPLRAYLIRFSSIPFLVALLWLAAGTSRAETNIHAVLPPAEMPVAIPAIARQVLLVTTQDWTSVPGTLRRFTRKDARSPWEPAGSAIPIVVGRNGLGWGKGVNPPANLPGPVKHEGDGKSPAGIFSLSSAFGLPASNEVSGLKLPYRQLTAGIECVDDVQSAHYNSILDRTNISPVDWNSSEKMRAVGAPYRLGIVVEHNTDPRQAGDGSCIFIHIWKNATTGTSGCTAMADEKMNDLISWIDPARDPILIQLPEAQYVQLKKVWKLP